MAFHEAYGEVALKTLQLIKRANVSPADWYDLEYMYDTDPERHQHILDHMVDGTYRPRYF